MRQLDAQFEDASPGVMFEAAARLVDRTTRAQGLPTTVDDGAALRVVADIVRRAPAEHSRKSRSAAA